MRTCLKNFSINDEANKKKYSIRKGDQVFLLPTCYFDEKIFENSDQFNPDRYLENSNVYRTQMLPF
jgi:cytochrome P450